MFRLKLFLLQIVIQFELLQLKLLTLIIVVGAVGAPSDEHVARQEQREDEAIQAKREKKKLTVLLRNARGLCLASLN